MTILNSFGDWMFYRLIANAFHITLDQAYWRTNIAMLIIVVLTVMGYVLVEYKH